MAERPFITKEELIQQLGISKSTFYRRLKALHITTSGRLLSADETKQIRQALGVSSAETSNKDQASPGK